jgi:3-oxoacyl-[acyl-carrier protein] reductase
LGAGEGRQSVTDTDVNGRVVIVTGAGRGIGRAIVRHLAASGATVVVAEIAEDRLESVVEEIRKSGAPCMGARCDVTDRDGFRSLADDVVSAFGRIDGLVNNAIAYGGPSPLAELDAVGFDPVWATGVMGTLWGMQAVYPHMKTAKWGRIVNVGSAAGVIGFP